MPVLNDADDLKLGSSQVDKVYLGSNLVWSPAASLFAPTVAALSPAVWWRLGDTIGSTTAADSSGNGRTGTVVNDPVFGTAGLVAGDSDTAVTMSADVVEIAGAAWMNATTWTVMIAFKRNGLPAATEYLASRSGAGTDKQFDLYLDTSGRVTARAWSGGGGNSYLATTTGSKCDNAPHIAFGTCDGTTVRVYVDSGTVAGSAAVVDAAPGSAEKIRIGGRSSGGSTLTGVLDEFAFWPGTVLTGTQIGDLTTAFGA